MHGTISPFNCVVFAEAALVTGTWQAGIMAVIRAKSITRLVIGTARGGRVSCIFGIVKGCESDMVLSRCWVLIITTIIGMIVFHWWVSIIVALEKFLRSLRVSVSKARLPWCT